MSVSSQYQCSEVRTFLLDFIEERVPLRQRLLFRLHLLMCPLCRRYMSRYKFEARRWQELGQEAEPPPQELVDLTLKFLSERVGDAPPPPDDTPS